MRGIKLDKNNNIVIEQGQIAFVEGIEKAAQDVKTTLGLVQGENPFNVLEGIDFENNVLGKMQNKTIVKDIITKRILENDEVVSVEKCNVDKKEDSLIIEATVNTIYGVVNV